MKVWNLGYPRIGPKRELKFALEKYWAGKISSEELEQMTARLRASRWARQHELGVDSIPLNDFSLYDHVLDMAFLLGIIPKRFQAFSTPQERYFAMARGVEGKEIPPLDMTKWFNTNYHYLVPEADASCPFELNWDRLKANLEFSRAYPYRFHVTLLGPWTLAKLTRFNGINTHDFIEKILPLYSQILKELKHRKVEWVQMDEPSLGSDLAREDIKIVKRIYDELGVAGPSLLLTSYFESPDPWLSELGNLRVAGVHFDLVQGRNTLSYLKTKSFSKDKFLSLGVVSGRNVWASSFQSLRREILSLTEIYDPQKIFLSPSCSLLHLPLDKNLEVHWGDEVKSYVSFADQRLEELSLLKKSFSEEKAFESTFQEREAVLRNLANSPFIHRGEIKQAVEKIDESMRRRKSIFSKRIKLQTSGLKLPLFPTTTIGSFPQTDEIRHARAQWREGDLQDPQYNEKIKEEITKVIQLQERLGLDVLTHGEAERSDMVEYFAERLEGVAVSSSGWVQSYGSRCAKPPLIFGDVKRKAPMTVEWFSFSQSLTKKTVKAVLTGPVTLLNWSFVREDQSREKTANQLALALREEVSDLEKAGAKVIQIDEPALREGLPLKRSQWNPYLKWAVDAFRLASGGVADATQIHTHMCYSDFSDVLEAVAKMDADVLLIESARSGDSGIEPLSRFRYPNDIGPGVYDIHSPHIPTENEISSRVSKLMEVVSPERLWINPDCGLKTRTFLEVETALSNLVKVAKVFRQKLQSK